MTDDPTAVLCDAVAAWVTVAALHLDQEKLDVLHACIEREGGDMYVVVRLREGAIVLDAVNREAGLRNELLRVDVEPLRPQTPFADPKSKGAH